MRWDHSGGQCGSEPPRGVLLCTHSAHRTPALGWILFYSLEIPQGRNEMKRPALVGVSPPHGVPGCSLGEVQSITSIEPRDGPAVCSPFSTAQRWRTTPETDPVPEHKVSGTVKDFVSFLSLQLFKYRSASLAPDAVSCGCH